MGGGTHGAGGIRALRRKLAEAEQRAEAAEAQRDALAEEVAGLRAYAACFTTAAPSPEEQFAAELAAHRGEPEPVVAIDGLAVALGPGWEDEDPHEMYAGLIAAFETAV